MKIVLAPQALKGSLDAEAVGAAMSEGVRIALPDAVVLMIPVADGGQEKERLLISTITRTELVVSYNCVLTMMSFSL